jgi:hypothetical protein
VAKRRYSKDFREFAVRRMRGAKTLWNSPENCTSRAGNVTGGVTSWIPRIFGMQMSGQNARAFTLRKFCKSLKPAPDRAVLSQPHPETE